MRLKSLALALLMSVIAACGDDSGGTLPLGSTTTTAATSTTGTTAPGTTTTVAPTTTAATTTTAPATTTTTTAAPPIQFRPDGLGIAFFGEGVDAVLAITDAAFGARSTDSGWLPGGFGDYGVCPGTQFRQVYYLADTLMIMFSDVEYFLAGGITNFIHYTYRAPTPLTTGPPTSIDIGNTVAQLTAMWPAVVVTGDDPLYGPSFQYDPGAGYEWLGGTLTGVAPGDTIEAIQGGVGCGE